MARLFNGSSDYGTFDGVGSFATWLRNRPFAFSITFYPTKDVANRQVVFADWDSSGTNQSIGVQIAAGGAIGLVVPTAVYGPGIFDIGVSAAVNRWFTVTGYWDGTAYGASVNGAAMAARSASSWASGSNLTLGRAGAYNGLYFGGQICDFAVWSLGGYTGFRSLSSGVSPLRVSPESLHCYAPLVGFGREETYGRFGDRATQNLTWSGTTAANDRYGFRQLHRNPRRKAVFV